MSFTCAAPLSAPLDICLAARVFVRAALFYVRLSVPCLGEVPCQGRMYMFERDNGGIIL